MDPYRHVLVVGSTGCERTGSAMESCLREALRSGYAEAVYDYKLQALERAQPYPMIGAHDFDVSPLHTLAEMEEAYQTIQH